MGAGVYCLGLANRNFFLDLKQYILNKKIIMILMTRVAVL
jgi:hypothetical protein